MEPQSARAILERLVAFPTVSSSPNLDIAEWIRAYLAGFGVESSLEFDESGRKAGLCALVGPRVPGGVVLSGHMMSFRSTARSGRPTRGRSSRRAAACTGAAHAT